MENRFGVKDFFLFALLTVLIVTVLLAMWQYDRQWKQLERMTVELTTQTRELSQIRSLLASGVSLANAPSAAAAVPPGFEVSQQSRLAEVARLPGYATGDWVVQATVSPPTRLTPLLDSDLFASRVQESIFDRLAVRNPETLKFIPSAATHWVESADGMSLTFGLRRDIVFSDGTPMTADDVVFTFNLVLNPEIEAERSRVYLQRVKSVEKVDAYTVRFTFSEYYFQNFEAVASTSILPKHFYEKISVSDFNASVGYALGSGPYRVADPTNWRYEPGTPFELVRNERYWGVPAPFDRVLWLMQPDAGARLIAFMNGETDRFGATPEQYREMIKDPRVSERAESFKFTAPDDGYFYVGWFQQVDGRPTPFADKRVRQAMTHLIDREGIVRDILYGFGAVASGPFDPGGAQHDASIQPWPFDPSRARQLLAEAGYTDRNGDGIVEDESGKPLSFKLSYPSSGSLIERICLYIRDTMRQGGVLCETEPVEWSVLLDRIRQKKVEAQVSGWGGSVEGDIYQMFHTSQIEGQGDNRTSYSNPRLDQLIEKARTTVNADERNALWRQCHALLHEDQPYTFLFRDDNLLFIDKRFENVKTNKMGVNSTREWFVPVAKQKWGK